MFLQGMRVLVQQAATGEFVVRGPKRTKDPDLALLFEHGSAAIEYASRKKLKDVPAVLKFGDAR